jgi:hypothetical protein
LFAQRGSSVAYTGDPLLTVPGGSSVAYTKDPLFTTLRTVRGGSSADCAKYPRGSSIEVLLIRMQCVLQSLIINHGLVQVALTQLRTEKT